EGCVPWKMRYDMDRNNRHVVKFFYGGHATMSLDQILQLPEGCMCDDYLKAVLMGVILCLIKLEAVTGGCVTELTPEDIVVSLQKPIVVYVRALEQIVVGANTPDSTSVYWTFVEKYIVPHVIDQFGCGAWMTQMQITTKNLIDIALHSWLLKTTHMSTLCPKYVYRGETDEEMEEFDALLINDDK
ncbi:hypothetical protein, partial [Salmonella enterica]|uniref:hypothetical protein n=1 Tax=Salmonella enterica TaxID=28901 RepID=UPI00135EABE6